MFSPIFPHNPDWPSPPHRGRCTSPYFRSYHPTSLRVAYKDDDPNPRDCNQRDVERPSKRTITQKEMLESNGNLLCFFFLPFPTVVLFKSFKVNILMHVLSLCIFLIIYIYKIIINFYCGHQLSSREIRNYYVWSFYISKNSLGLYIYDKQKEYFLASNGEYFLILLGGEKVMLNYQKGEKKTNYLKCPYLIN